MEELVLCLTAPLASSAVSLLMGRVERGKVQQHVVLMGGAVLSLLASLLLFSTASARGAIDAPTLYAYVEAADALAVVAVSLVALLASAYEWGMSIEGRLPAGVYASLFLSLLFCSIYMVVARDAVMLFILVEALIGVSVALVAHSRDTSAPEVAFRYLVITALSALCVLLGAAMAILATGTSDVMKPPARSREVLALATVCFIMGLGADIGFFPLHSWVPDAFSASTSTVNVLFCAEHIALFLALYKLLRPASYTPYAPAFTTLLVVLGLSSILFGYLLAYSQEEYMRLMAYYTISDYGYLLLLLGVALREPVHLPAWRMYLINSALMEAGMLACLGTALTREMWGSLSLKARRAVALCFVICALSSLGLPPLSGFYAKLLLYKAVYGFLLKCAGLTAATALVVVLLLLSLIPLALLVRTFHDLLAESVEERAGELGIPRVAALLIPPVAAAGAALLLGMWPQLLLPG
ncbi:MAG: hypothetical protein DRK00_02605 [Thermoprotei archaeon]|nr:MAG: hypothetical protein DRK00_02605 [Thermoprotei archaeon]